MLFYIKSFMVVCALINYQCSIDFFISMLNQIYSQNEKEIVKKVDINDYADSFKHNLQDSTLINHQTKISDIRVDEISYLVDSLIVTKIYSRVFCYDYFLKRIGDYEEYQWTEVVPMRYIVLYSYHNYLNGKPLKYDSLINYNINLLQSVDSVARIEPTADTLDGVYIPKDFDDALLQLEKLAPKEIKEQFLRNNDIDDATIAEHHGLGMAIRNIWKLWGNSRLSIYLEPHCLDDADEKSALILYGYYLKLHNKPHTLEHAFKYYLDNLKKEGFYESYLEEKEQYLERKRKLQERKK